MTASDVKVDRTLNE